MKIPEREQLFENYRKHLVSEAQRLTGYIALHTALGERRQDRLEEMNIAPAFFSATIDALFSVIIIWTEKMFDANSQRGLMNFLTFCEQHRKKILTVKDLKRRNDYPDDHWMIANRADVSLQDIKDHRTRIEQLTWMPSIRTRRDKFHAHFDAAYFFDRKKIALEAPLHTYDLVEIVSVMHEVINHYSTAYDGQIFALEVMNSTDVDGLLDRLHRSRNVGGSSA